jgi:2-oxoglutarate dehydrogenase E2 component (dihydrolipoamide succinyltransferase)
VAGRIERILVAEGTAVAVGAELATIDPDASAQHAPAPQAEAADAVRATPVARRVADQASLDLTGVHGTGTAGRITKEDVLSHVAPPEPALPEHPAPVPERIVGAPEMERPAAPVAAPARAASAPTLPHVGIELEEGDRVVPMTAQRRMIAAHMVYSKHTSPHVGTVAEVDLGGVSALRSRHADAFRERHRASLTLLPFVGHCAVRALREFPALNASVADDAIVERGNVHLSIAVETEKWLLAPVVRHADRLSLTGLALAIAELSGRARDRKLSPDDLRGGTFTVSNPGRKGNLYGFAIINQPQVGILRLGEVVKRPVVRTVEGQDVIVIRPMMHIALSYDHRAVDGARANAFLFRIRELLESADFEL